MRTPTGLPLLSHPFKREGSWHPFGRLVLFADRIEYRALGRVQETLPLADVRDVLWRTTDNDAPNFSLLLDNGATFSGRLRGAGLWKAQLQEMLSRPRKAPRGAATGTKTASSKAAA